LNETASTPGSPDPVEETYLAGARLPDAVRPEKRFEGMREAIIACLQKSPIVSDVFPHDDIGIWDELYLPEGSPGSGVTPYLEFTELRQAASAQQRVAEEFFSRDNLLRSLTDYVIEQMSDVHEQDSQHLMQALRFFEEETRSIGILRATVEAAVAWAFLGGIVAWLLTHLF
jgi:hypothetical protein